MEVNHPLTAYKAKLSIDLSLTKIQTRAQVSNNNYVDVLRFRAGDVSSGLSEY